MFFLKVLISLCSLIYFVKGACTSQIKCNTDPLYDGLCYVHVTKSGILQKLYKPCPEGESCQKDEYDRYVCQPIV